MVAIYSTDGLLYKNNGLPGKQIVVPFATPADAIAAPIPEGCTFASVSVKSGQFVYTRMFGWKFYRRNK